MELFQVIVLAVIQGLTEFLPISSSAHLILPKELLGWPDQGLAFDVAVHVGSLVAVLGYFRHEVLLMAKSWCRSLLGGPQNDESRLAWAVFWGTIPVGLAGYLFDDVIATHLRSSLVIAATTILFGLLLWYSDTHGQRVKDLSALDWKSILIIGCMQALALIPGTSRSGITITAALLIGYKREAAARYSFLLSIPLILIGGAFKGAQLSADDSAPWADIILATGLSAVTAYLCIHWFLQLLDKIGLLPFVIYRLLLGAVILLLVFLG